MSEIITDRDMRVQVEHVLAGAAYGVEGYDIRAIVTELIERFGRVDVDSAPAETFWQIVKAHMLHPPIACTTWCSEAETDGEGHQDDHPHDQACRSEYLDVTRTLAPQWRDAAGEWQEQITQVYAISGPQWHPQVVIYDYGASDVEMPLTASEARTMARHLLHCADLLEPTD